MANDDRPVYIRLRDVIAEAILDGRYRDGDPLPSVRALAAEHGANPLTVAKAYQSFQDDGYVEVRRGVGMFVAARTSERTVARLHAETVRALKTSEVRARLDQLGADAAPMPQQAFAQQVREEVLSTTALIRRAGIRIDS